MLSSPARRRGIGSAGEAVNQHGMEVSVVMPCLDEAETLEACIRKAREALRPLGSSAEIIVADNGSRDGSPEVARALGARCIDVSTRGYGAALLAGIEAARGTYVVMGDADDTYDFRAIPPFVAHLRAGADLVIGCRVPSGGGTILSGAMPWSHRWIGVPLLSATGRALFGSPVTDFHCGLRAFRRDAMLALDLRATGMEFASEMIIRATLAGLKVVEVPVTLWPGGRTRPSHLRAWRDGWRHVLLMLRCRIRARAPGSARTRQSDAVSAQDEVANRDDREESGGASRQQAEATLGKE
jgi:glycosyltransferase involved in cell wall biosynthesis